MFAAAQNAHQMSTVNADKFESALPIEAGDRSGRIPVNRNIHAPSIGCFTFNLKDEGTEFSPRRWVANPLGFDQVCSRTP